MLGQGHDHLPGLFEDRVGKRGRGAVLGGNCHQCRGQRRRDLAAERVPDLLVEAQSVAAELEKPAPQGEGCAGAKLLEEADVLVGDGEVDAAGAGGARPDAGRQEECRNAVHGARDIMLHIEVPHHVAFPALHAAQADLDHVLRIPQATAREAGAAR
jgi:hypothetical protein